MNAKKAMNMNLFEDKELDENSVVKDSLTTATGARNTI
jgi:hypothetical protein